MTASPLSWIGPLALPRLVLLLNHIVSSEPQAVSRLQPHAGRTIEIRWRSAVTDAALPGLLSRIAPAADSWLPPPVRLQITPAGLFDDDAPADVTAGLLMTVALPDPLTLARKALRGERPDVAIEGDAALAEVASWLMNNLRWDAQDDVARWMGTAPAEMLRMLGGAVRQALQRWRPGMPR